MNIFKSTFTRLRVAWSFREWPWNIPWQKWRKLEARRALMKETTGWDEQKESSE